MKFEVPKGWKTTNRLIECRICCGRGHVTKVFSSDKFKNKKLIFQPPSRTMDVECTYCGGTGQVKVIQEVIP